MDATRRLRMQFESPAIQRGAAHVGMWAFVASEVLFFGALFALYAAYRAHYPDLFRQAARHSALLMGSANTVILITSSLFVALALAAAREGRSHRRIVGMLAAAMTLGIAFLLIKGLEYSRHIAEGIRPGGYYDFPELPQHGAQIFFTLYYFMTGLHAVHVAIGVALLGWLARRAWKGSYDPSYYTPLELGGMYWHLVDLIWVFLWPMFYLIR